MRKFFVLYSKRINRHTLIILLASTIILSKFFSIQVLNNNQLKQTVTAKGWKTKIELGPRGKIFDSNNKELAVSSKKYTFWVNTNKPYDENKIIELFSSLFNKPKEYYINKLKKKTNYLKLEKNITFLDSREILKNKNIIKGLNIEENEQRFYPYGNLACQTIGYLNINNQGVGGIEGRFNNILNGDTLEIQLRKGVKGKYYKTIKQNDLIKEGSNIVLTIDIELQKILDEELTKTITRTNAKSANGIIMDPVTGDILAMSTVPTFNPNNYYNYSIEYYKNKVISEAYEPGSTFKIIALSSILESNLHSFDDIFNCENGYTTLINGKPLRDHEPHEDLSLIDIFAHSSNIGMSKIVEDLDDFILYKYCKLFGFGTKTGIPLNDESKGQLRNLYNWSNTSKIYLSIGQELSVTNLQLATAYCAIANGGYLLKPNIIKKIYRENKVIYERDIKPIRKVFNNIDSDMTLNLLSNVVTHGTAKNLNLEGYKIGGKTGTAQKYINGSYSKNEFISSFVSVFPINNPQYVVLISVDSPNYGFHWANESAVPASKEIIKRIIIYNYNLQTNNELIADNSSENMLYTQQINLSNQTITDDNSSYIVPNLRGKPLKEALIIAKTMGFRLEPYGISGKIVWQSLVPGKIFNNNDICKVKLEI